MSVTISTAEWVDVAYRCKVCERPGVAKLDRAARGMMQLPIWISWLTCNRCADYLQERVRLREKIIRIAVRWDQIRHGKVEAQAVERLLGKLESHLCALRELVGGHWAVTVVHEAGWRERIEARPGYTESLLNRMEASVRGRDLSSVPSWSKL